jgi:hypothetical protein
VLFSGNFSGNFRTFERISAVGEMASLHENWSGVLLG